MAQNVSVNTGTGATIAADLITGDASLGTADVQYFKLMDATIGGTNKAVVSASGALSVSDFDDVASGTISATDAVVAAPTGNGVPYSGTPTAGSYVAMAINGSSSSWIVSITGSATGAYYFEESADSTTGADGTWININARQTGITNTVLGYSTTTIGVFRGNTAGGKYVRVRNVGGTSPSNPVVIRASVGTGAVFLNASIPSGSNTIGTVTAAQATGSNLHAVVDSGTITTVSAVTAITNALPTGSNVIGALTANQSVNVAQISGSAPTVKTASTAAVAADPALVVAVSPNNTVAVTQSTGTSLHTVVDSGTITTVSAVTAITNALPTGTNSIGTVQPGNTPNTTPWLVQTVPGTANGWSVLSTTALTSTVLAVKASAGLLGGYMLYNPNSVVIYIQVFNVASGSVTIGTTTPTYVIPLPAAAAANVQFQGITHATAISVAATTTPTGSTAPTTALVGFFIYK